MNKLIIGIDPGQHGAISWYSHNEDAAATCNMPETYQEIYDILLGIKVFFREMEPVCYLEDVGHGVPNQSSKATASFARHCGHLEMALYALGFKVVKVLPSKWQKTLSIGKSSDCADKREWKNKLKQKAQELYPNIKVTLSNADALLILDYGIKQERI